MRSDTGVGKDIAEWFETFLKVVCWNFELEPMIPYHDLANEVVKYLEPERKDIKEQRPWRKKK